MEAFHTKEDLVQAFESSIGRRQFLKGLVALGVTLVAARVYANAIHPVLAGLASPHHHSYYGDMYYGDDYPPDKPPVNRRPKANAGPDQHLAGVAGGTPATLDGTGSFDPDGDPLTYSWLGAFAGNVASGPSPTVVFSTPGIHWIYLTVDDGRGKFDTDKVKIEVLPASQEELSLVVSGSPSRSGAVPLAGAEVAGDIAVFIAPVFPEADIKRVEFRHNGQRARRENHAPYDFAGGSASAAVMKDTTQWDNGSHYITASIEFRDGTRRGLSGTFTVNN